MSLAFINRANIKHLLSGCFILWEVLSLCVHEWRRLSSMLEKDTLRCMKRGLIFLLCIAILGTAAWSARGLIRDWYRQRNVPQLPSAETYQQSPTGQATTTASNENKKPPTTPSQATSTKSVVKDPFVFSGTLPTEKNLAVPFLSQAPKGNWNMPYQEACEETAAIMVDVYYKGRKTAFRPDEGDKAILDLVAFEKKLLGKYQDTTAQETARFIRAYFHRQVVIKQGNDPLDIKRAIANGFPVIVPADGKTLANPNFRNGGPIYHMLVIKGWTKNGHWITNDPGTRLGADFLYTQDNLKASMRDWNNGDVSHGTPQMIVIMPASS